MQGVGVSCGFENYRNNVIGEFDAKGISSSSV